MAQSLRGGGQAGIRFHRSYCSRTNSKSRKKLNDRMSFRINFGTRPEDFPAKHRWVLPTFGTAAPAQDRVGKEASLFLC
jgi:hypothetical protein